jgi:hypothetical protein
MPFMLMALRFKLALVLQVIRWFPICCRSLLRSKNAGAWSSSWGHPLGGRRRLESGAPPCWEGSASVRGALGPDAVPPVRSLAALGLPLVLLVAFRRDGGSEPPDGVPGLTAASPLP